MSASPKMFLVVAGTGTEVGKTWVAQRLLQQARAWGLRVAACKPVQSYSVDGGATDADMLAAAAGQTAEEVCPRHRWYPLPMAPPMAADVLQQPPLQLDQLLGEITWPAATDFALLETAGGIRSPITHDADNGDLIRRLAPHEVLLVAEAGLGTLNAVRLSLQALQGMTVTVLLNRFDGTDDLHRRNFDWLVRHDRTATITDAEQWWTIRRRGTTPDPPSRG